jgi:hypothetical protein
MTFKTRASVHGIPDFPSPSRLDFSAPGMPNSSKRRGRSGLLVFENWNYVLLLIGVALIVVGFTAMYLENQYQGFVSLYVSPILIVGGYAEIIYALLWSPSEEEPAEEGQAARQ